MVIKSFSLILFKQAPLAAGGHTKPISSHGMICFSLPKFMPRSIWWVVKHTYCSVEQTLLVVFFLASLAACSERYKNYTHLLSPKRNVIYNQYVVLIYFCGFSVDGSLHAILLQVCGHKINQQTNWYSDLKMKRRRQTVNPAYDYRKKLHIARSLRFIYYWKLHFLMLVIFHD